MMARLRRLAVGAVLVGLLVIAVAGTVSATDLLPTACWNNCGIGGVKTGL